MTNNKKDLFATLGLVTTEINKDSVVEMSVLESVEADLKDLEDINTSYDVVEATSMESIAADLDTLSQVMAYKNIEKSQNSSDIYLESISSEFGIATEDLKSMVKKGVSISKSTFSKIKNGVSKLASLSVMNKKMLKDLEDKTNNIPESANNQKVYVELVSGYAMFYLLKAKVTHDKITLPNDNVPQEVKKLTEGIVNDVLKDGYRTNGNSVVVDKEFKERMGNIPMELLEALMYNVDGLIADHLSDINKYAISNAGEMPDNFNAKAYAKEVIKYAKTVDVEGSHIKTAKKYLAKPDNLDPEFVKGLNAAVNESIRCKRDGFKLGLRAIYTLIKNSK